MDTQIRWGLLLTGVGVLACVAIIAVVLATSGQSGQMGSGIWLVAFLPVAATVGGAVIIAGRDS